MRKETRCRHIGYSFRLAARVLLYASSHRQDSTYHGLCYTSRGALAGTRNSSWSPPHEGSIRRPIAPWANALPLSYVPLPNPKVFLGDYVRGCRVRSGRWSGGTRLGSRWRGQCFPQGGANWPAACSRGDSGRKPAPAHSAAGLEGRKEGNGLFNDALNTFYLQL